MRHVSYPLPLTLALPLPFHLAAGPPLAWTTSYGVTTDLAGDGKGAARQAPDLESGHHIFERQAHRGRVTLAGQYYRMCIVCVDTLVKAIVDLRFHYQYAFSFRVERPSLCVFRQ